VLASYGDGTLRVFNLATGALETEISQPHLTSARYLAVAADRRRLYYAVGSDDTDTNSIVAVDLPGGRLRWRRGDVPLVDEPEMVIERDALYVETTGNFVTALDPKDGRSRWRWGIGRAFEIVRAPSAGPHAAIPPLVVADLGGGLWRFARAARASDVKPVVIAGRVRSNDETYADHPFDLAVGPTRVRTDRRGRFRVVLHAPGAIRLAVADSDFQGLYWRREGGGEQDQNAVIVRPDGGTRWLDLSAPIYYEDCH
jgi:hypothetical protein